MFVPFHAHYVSLPTVSARNVLRGHPKDACWKALLTPVILSYGQAADCMVDAFDDLFIFLPRVQYDTILDFWIPSLRVTWRSQEGRRRWEWREGECWQECWGWGEDWRWEVGARAAKCNPVEVRCAPNRLIHTTDFDLIIVFKVCICIEVHGKEHHYPLLNV